MFYVEAGKNFVRILVFLTSLPKYLRFFDLGYKVNLRAWDDFFFF